MNYTSIEQSKKLLELGLKPETADMFWRHYNQDGYDYPIVETPFEERMSANIPCWSVSQLIRLMPDETSLFYKYYHTSIITVINTVDAQKRITIIRNKHKEEGKTLIEATYNMIVWLLQNNYIKIE